MRKMVGLSLVLVAWSWAAAPRPLCGEAIDLSLDLHYDNPQDTNSAGTWQLVAKASDRGIVSLVARLVDVQSGAVLEAPYGSGTSLLRAGYRDSFAGGTVSWATDHGDHWELLFAQPLISAPGPQGYFYDVGVPGGATQPGENGTPAVTGFVAGNNVPWNFNDTLGDLLDDGLINESGQYEGGVLLASGTFAANSSPGFYVGGDGNSTGDVFTSLGTSTDPPSTGSIVEATTFNTVIRDNTSLVILGDMNGDLVVDEDDVPLFVQALTNRNAYQTAFPDINADFVGDFDNNGQLDLGDVKLFSQTVSNSTAANATSVPEPETISLVLFLVATCTTLQLRPNSFRSRRRQM